MEVLFWIAVLLLVGTVMVFCTLNLLPCIFTNVEMTSEQECSELRTFATAHQMVLLAGMATALMGAKIALEEWHMPYLVAIAGLAYISFRLIRISLGLHGRMEVYILRQITATSNPG